MPEVDVPVEFQGVSIGADTARLGLRIAREQLTLLQADDLFARFRLSGRVVLGGFNDSPGQTTFEDLTEIAADFDVKGFRATDKHFSVGLTFAKDAVDVETLSGFAKETGRFVVDAIGEIPDDEDDDDGESEIAAGSLFSRQEDWRSVPLDSLFEGRVLKAFKGAGLDTLGAFVDYQAKKGDYWAVDLKGVGGKAQEEIEARMLAFWRDNPQFGEQSAATES